MTTALDLICICGHEGRRHHAPGNAYAGTCSLCSCMYFETPPIDDARPIDEALMDALRCTQHITDDRRLRARYVLTDLRLRGWIVQRARRDAKGHFVRADR